MHNTIGGSVGNHPGRLNVIGIGKLVEPGIDARLDRLRLGDSGRFYWLQVEASDEFLNSGVIPKILFLWSKYLDKRVLALTDWLWN